MIEQTILAYCIRFPKKIDYILGEIGVSDFHDGLCAAVFGEIRNYLAGGGVADRAALMVHLSQRSVASLTDLNVIDDISPTFSTLDEYIRLLKAESAMHSLRVLCEEMQRMVRDGKDARDILCHTQSVAYKVQGRLGFQNEVAFLPELLERWSSEKEREFAEPGYNRVNTGFPSLDRITKGFRRGSFIVLGAETSAGKSAFALNVARYVAFKQKKRVDFFSLEMGRDEVFERLLVLESGVGASNPVDVSSLMRLKAANKRVSEENKGRFIVQDSTDLNVSNIRSRVLGLDNAIAEPELGLIVVDYIQLLGSGVKTSNRTEEVGKITRDLKRLAGELNVPILALSQLNRPTTAPDTTLPLGYVPVSRLRESGTIGQDANIILMLTRDKTDKEVSRIHVAKNRNGQTDEIIEFYFHSNRCEFEETRGQIRRQEYENKRYVD